MIWLERQGKIDLAGVGSFHTGPNVSGPEEHPCRDPAPPVQKERFWRRAWRVLTENRLECSRGENRFEVPLAVLIALLVFAIYAVAGLLLLGLAFGWRYHFAGPELGKKAVNDVMDDIDDTAENIREIVRNNFKK